MDLYYSVIEGRTGESQDLQVIGQKLTDLFTSGGRTLYPATKAAMDCMGFYGGPPRSPLMSLNETALEGLESGLKILQVMK
jgi:4-hydroxy-tetrahydrodipicolinate synthase